MKRNENTTIEIPYRLSTTVLFPSLESQRTYGAIENLVNKTKKNLTHFLDIYNKNNKVVVRRSICYLD